MGRLTIVLAIAVCATVILGVGGEKKSEKKRETIYIQAAPNSDIFQWLCNNNNLVAGYLDICSQYTTTAKTSTKSTTTSSSTLSTSSSQSGSSDSSSPYSTTTTPESTTESSTLSSSALERAHWCQFTNGSYIPLGYTFMYTSCAICQCTQSRQILCSNLQCMPTYCIDDSTPSRRSGQCCTQCAYEVNSTSCVQNGITVPHGTILKTTSDGVQCWCQLGTVECRKSIGSGMAGLDLLGNGTAIYIVVIVICVLLILGTLLCGGCGLIYYYYYYRRTQQSMDQAYGEYWNNAGWQPMGEEQVADAENKQAEAEQSQFDQSYPTGNSEEYIPPPYALYNGAHANEQKEKDQRIA